MHVRAAGRRRYLLRGCVVLARRSSFLPCRLQLLLQVVQRRPDRLGEQADRVVLGRAQHHLDVAAAGLRGEQAVLGAGAADVRLDVGVLRQDLLDLAWPCARSRASGVPDGAQ